MFSCFKKKKKRLKGQAPIDRDLAASPSDAKEASSPSSEISDVVVPGQSEDLTAREALLLWSRRMVEGYPGVKISDFSRSWRDGKAFLAILHRNRPDLVDFRQVRNNSPRQNLELAFTTADREFGVTRLLDPEDIDVADPDEKSVLTYVSSLYDVFPEVPSVEQSLRENERQLKVEEYKELASNLLSWLRDATSMMLDRKFPATLMEMKALLADFNRFKIEDVPPRLEIRQKLLKVYDDFQAAGPGASHLGIEDDLSPENLNRAWNRFTVAQQERDLAMQAEVLRLERLQRLAEKIHREAKHSEDSLDDIDRRIRDEQRRIEIVHPLEAKRTCDALDRALRNTEDTLRSLVRDATALQDGHFATADQLYKRVSNLQSRVSQLRTVLYSDVMQRLISKSYVEEGTSLSMRREVVTEVRLVETNPAFRHVQDCLNWIEAKQASLEAAEHGHDLPSAQTALDQHHREHQEVIAFRKEIEKCIQDRRTLNPEEQKLYTEWLSKVEVAYSLLTNTSMRRLKCLESLLEFVQSATQELMWLNEHEEAEISRDWSASDLNVAQIEQFFKTLTHQMEVRETQFNSVQDRGEALVLDRHPAAKTIEAYMSAMQSQWSWLLQLAVCLESHLKHAAAYHQFFDDAHKCEQWMSRQAEMLNSRFSRENMTIEELEIYIKELQDLHDQLLEYDTYVSSIVAKSREIVPLKQRNKTVYTPVNVQCLCNYKQSHMSLQRGEECVLLNNEQRIKWRVKSTAGQDDMAPAVCFLIPPPNPEAIDLADRLHVQLEHLHSLWKMQHRRHRQNMVFATIKIVKNWDLPQFQALDPARREAFWRALNEDAEKLLLEVGESDRDMRKLRAELKECNEIFVKLSTAAMEEEARKARTPDRNFVQQMESVSRKLLSCDQSLSTRLHEPLPRDRAEVKQAALKEKEWEMTLRGHEGEFDDMKHSYASLTLKSPQIESRLNLIVQKWDQMWAISHVYVERLKSSDLVLVGLDSVRQLIADYEIILASHENMSSEPDALRSLREKLQDLQRSMQQQQPKIDNLKRDVTSLRALVEHSRPGATRHPDLEALEKEVRDVGTRWDNVAIQLVERLRGVESSSDLISLYRNGLKGEQQWVVQMQRKLESQPPLPSDLEEVKKLLEPTMSIYNALGERQHQIEQVNKYGGQYIREAKGRFGDSYDKLAQDLHNQINWASDIEQLLKDDQPISDEAYKVQSQLEAQKALHEDILKHQQPILSLVYQAEQLVEHHQEELTPEQVTELQHLSAGLKATFNKVLKTSDTRVKHLTSASDELTKFEAEIKKFDIWLDTSLRELARQEEMIRDLDNLKRTTEQHKALSDDVIAHQGDLRFMSMAVTKYMEEAKLHKLEVDAFKVDRQKPSRLSWLGMEGMEAETVRDRLKDTTNRYEDLKGRCNKFSSRLSGLSAKQREFNENTFKMLSWLTDAEEKLSESKQGASTTDPDTLRDYLEKMKNLGSDTIAHSVQLEELEKTKKDLSESMREMDVSPDNINKLQDIVDDISGRHKIVKAEVNERANGLQTALTKSQNVEDAMENLLGWLRDTDSLLNNQRPISLSRENLNEQIQELKVIEADLEGHKRSIDSVKHEANELIKNCDLDMAKSLEAKLSDINKKYNAAQGKCKSRNKDLNEVSEKLNKFQDGLQTCNNWLLGNIEILESRDWTKKSDQQKDGEVEEMDKEKKQKLQALEQLMGLGQELVGDERTGETAGVKDSLADLDRNWSDFDGLLAEREKEVSAKEQQANEYDSLKKAVVEWLAVMEEKVDNFQPVAVDVEVVDKQVEELQPMLGEYQQFAPKIDEVNDQGNALDVLNSDRPSSPIRRIVRGRRYPNILSPRLQSPSPTFQMPSSPTSALSPLSSESSGVSSRKSSSDNFLVEDMSEIQQELVDVNQRYEVLGDRLADRQQELQNMLDSMRTFLQDLADLLTWLDIKEGDVDITAGLPTNEKEAKRRLKEYEAFHQELLGKEHLVEDIRRKGQELLKVKKGVPGMDTVQQQLAELDDKWLGIKVASEQRRKALEDMVGDIRTFKEAGVHLQKWVAQKEKMIGVLGPVATEPSMITNQLEQVKVLQDELRSQEPLYEQFIQSGHSILDKCEPSSRDTAQVSEKMDVISKGWERLHSRLGDRSKNLHAVEGLSAEFSETVQKLGNWTADFCGNLEHFGPISPTPEKRRSHLAEVKELQAELKRQRPMVEKARDLYRRLCETTKDPATKQELKNKLASLEKPLTEADKKLVIRAAEVEQASREGEKFNADCRDMLDWIDEARERLDNQDPVSGQEELLKDQAQQNKEFLKDLTSRKPEVRALLEKGQKLLDSSSNSADARDMAEKLQTLQHDWEELNRTAKKRDQQLEASTKHSQVFREHLDKMLLWLQLNEKKAHGLTPHSLDKEVVARKLKEAQALQADILKRSHDHEILNREGQALVNSVDKDSDNAGRELEKVNERWDKLNDVVGEHVQDLEDISQRLSEYHDNLRDINSGLHKFEEKMDGHRKLGTSGKDPKHLDKIQALQEDVTSLHSQLDYMEALVDGFTVDHGDSAATDGLVKEQEKAKQRHSKLQKNISELLSDIEAGSQIVDEFQDKLRSTGIKMADLESDLEKMMPIAREESELFSQLHEIEEFLSHLGDMETSLTDLEHHIKNLLEAGYITDPATVRGQLQALKSQFDKLKDKAQKRHAGIEDTSKLVEQVNDNLRRTRTSIDRAASELDMHEPAGSDVTAIKRQQEELQLFLKVILEPLQKRVEVAIADSQNLIQSAGPGVNTGSIESDLESLTEKWSDLNKKVSDRERNLDNALMQAGKFTEALDHLLSWLKETEEMIANQKPASPDFKVVKAQLQEQKFLQKMLGDREPNVRSVKLTGANLLQTVDPREQKGIQNQIAQLEKRWDALNSNASSRMKVLDDVMGLAKEFQDLREPLLTWLDIMEKKFALLEPAAMDTDGIENLIQSLEEMQNDIGSKEEQVRALFAKGKQLQEYCKGEEAKSLQKKIDDIQMRYGELREKVSDTLEQMEEALPLAQNFNDAQNKFLNWVANVEPEMRQKDLTGPDAEEQVQKLLDSLEEIQPIMEVLVADGGQLAELAPGDAGLKVEDTIARDNKRFEGISDQIQKRADKFKLSKQKSSEVMGEIMDLTDWFEDTERHLLEAEPISSDPQKLQAQLTEQKVINEDINGQKGKSRDLMAAGKKFLRENMVEEEPIFREKMDTLKQRADTVGKLGTDRQSLLEQALPLGKHFQETHGDLLTWFDEIEPALAELEVMSINAEQVKKQQEKIKVLKQDVQDNKPLCDRLNKTGTALLKICGADDGKNVQKLLDNDNQRMEGIRHATRERSMSIDEALAQSAEFTDQLENILEALTGAKEQVQQSDPIAAHPSKIREQISDNKGILEDMDMRESALESVKATAQDLIKQATNAQDDAVKDVKQKLDELVRLYNDINCTAQDRNRELEDTLEVAEKFWEDLHSLLGTLKDLQESLESQDPPALEPSIIREQQEQLESLKEDLETAQVDIDDVQDTGKQLISMAGEPDRPEVQKNLDDLDTNMSALNSEYEKRTQKLEDALVKATHFQDELMKLLVWLQKREDKFREMEPVGADFETIKEQWTELKDFKTEVEPKQVEIEALNQQANEMVRESSPEQASVVKEPIVTVNRRWDNLIEGIGDRNRLLQMAMLNIGQFEHAINELLAWLDKTEQTMDEAQPVYGDPKHIEIELAKHKILQNDIHAHREGIEKVNEAGQRVIATEGTAQASSAQRKINDMNRLWDTVQQKSQDRQEELEESLKEAQGFAGELQDMLMCLGELEGLLITSQPVGGLPETAKEQLEKFQTVSAEMEKLEPSMAKIGDDGRKLISKCRDPAASNIKQNLQLLKQRWDHIKARAQDRKTKLEEAVQQADNFHVDLNKFITWLTDTEKTLNNLNPVSRLVEPVTKQIEDHKVLQKDVSRHREAMIGLDRTGTHLKYFSQKQDVILIKNLLSSVQHRWEKIVSRSAERTRHLERGYKEAKQFHEGWHELLDWLKDAEKVMEADQSVSNDPVKIKMQIIKHKEFQRSLGAKQPMYDGVNKSARSLKERCPPEDVPVIQQMNNEVKNKWNNLCGKSVDRQRKLEEALLFSGQFNEALQALLDWLAKVEPTLGEDQPVHGDIDTVNNLVEEHRAFQQELGARANNVKFVRKRAQELMEKSDEDTSQQQAQLIELSTMWDRVCKLSVNKQERLQQAHKLGEEFDKKAHELLGWLSNAERQLRYRGPIPDEEPALLKQIDDHKKLEEDLLRQEANLREALTIGQDIMKRCHPDAVSTLKHWLSVLRHRWEEVTSWSKQRGRRLAEGLSELRTGNAVLDELLGWLNGAETRMIDEDQEPVPQDISTITELLKDHQDFQNDMSSKQPDVDRVTKLGKQRTSSTSSEPLSHIPILKGLSGRRTPVKRTPRKRGHDEESGRRTPEPHFKNPRIGALFNKWRGVWLMAMDRQRKLQDALDYLNEVEKMKNFDFDDWRKRYLKWMRHNKSRIMDFFRRQDKDRDGKVTRKEFIDGILASKFPTSQLEMEAVVNIFDRDSDGYIDYKEFVSALRPPDKTQEPITDTEKILDEVKRQVSKCTCVKQFKIHKIGEGKYRFGDSQKLRLVRILRSTVMVRVGGGWVALDEFLVKNDPCRAKGRTNVELREQFILRPGTSQAMSGFVTKSPNSSSYSGSSTHSGTASPWSGRSPSSASGPITKIREKTQYPTPWKQRVKQSPDGEVHQIMSRTNQDGTRVTKIKSTREVASPRSPAPGTPVSRSSSRASTNTGSRPPSRTGSEASDTSEPDVFTTVQTETRNVGGRNLTTVTYQTHQLQTRTVTMPTVTTSKISKIPKPSPGRKK